MSHSKIPRYVMAINRHRMVGSMGRVGKAGDNAAIDSSFSLLQKNALDRRSWTTREELRIAIVRSPSSTGVGSSCAPSRSGCAIEEKALVASVRHRLLGRTFLVVEVSEVQVAVREHCEGNDA